MTQTVEKVKLLEHFKFKEDPVRKKSERIKLLGYECKCCKEYYESLDLSDVELEERMNYCSRHRGNHRPPKTPEHFWEIGFPDAQECIARGYVRATTPPPITLRKRKRFLVEPCDG
jgi:hypothetical protein